MDAEEPTRPDRLARFGRFIATLTGFTAFASAGLYLAGNVSRNNSLNDLGVPSDLFPQGVEATMVAGYYAIVTQWAATLFSLRFVLIIGAALALYGVLSAAQRYLQARANSRDKRPETNEKMPQTWWKRALEDTSKAALIAFIILYALAFLTFLLALPGYMGEKAGRARAERAIACFERSAKSGAFRESLVDRRDAVIAKGFVIAASPTHVALYDTDLRSVRLVEHTGLEIRAWAMKRSDKPSDSAAAALLACR